MTQPLPLASLPSTSAAIASALRSPHGDGSTLTLDDLAVASRIQRLVGDHRHPVGQAGPWSPRGTLAGIRPRPVGQAGP